ASPFHLLADQLLDHVARLALIRRKLRRRQEVAACDQRREVPGADRKGAVQALAPLAAAVALDAAEQLQRGVQPFQFEAAGGADDGAYVQIGVACDERVDAVEPVLRLASKQVEVGLELAQQSPGGERLAQVVQLTQCPGDVDYLHPV